MPATGGQTALASVAPASAKASAINADARALFSNNCRSGCRFSRLYVGLGRFQLGLRRSHEGILVREPRLETALFVHGEKAPHLVVAEAAEF